AAIRPFSRAATSVPGCFLVFRTTHGALARSPRRKEHAMTAATLTTATPLNQDDVNNSTSAPADLKHEDCGKLVYPRDWLWFRDKADFEAFWQGECAMPERCIGLETSESSGEILAHDPIKVELSCDCKLLEQLDGFYFHGTRHFAR